jgi:hypothetical protein
LFSVRSSFRTIREEPIGRPEQARSGERQDEPRTPFFEGVSDEHRGYGKEAEERQATHFGSVFFVYAALSTPRSEASLR